MLDPQGWQTADIPADRPLLIVVVDTEEEFDWSLPLARHNTATTAMAAQHRAHRIYEGFGIRPTYVMDYPVATQPDGYQPLLELYRSAACDIGAHLHPWVNPPFDEQVCNRNSYPGNLPAKLERAKLGILTDAIAERFGTRPTVYKAGRYGVGPATTETLHELGYRVDTSVVAGTDFTESEGPDFRHCGARPYWFGGARRLLEIPLTSGYAGALAARGGKLYRRIASPAGRGLLLPNLCARLGLLEAIRLTPEGITFAEQRRLSRAMLAAGHRVFCYAYHSPSLAPGHTPYVRSTAELGQFLDRMKRYFDYFFGELGGGSVTAAELRLAAEGAQFAQAAHIL